MTLDARHQRRKRVWTVVIVAALSAVVLAILIFVAVSIYYSRNLEQNMRTIDEYIQVAGPLLSSNPDYASVELYGSTAHLGSIHIEGAVPSIDVLEALHREIENTSPPRRVEWHVDVVDR